MFFKMLNKLCKPAKIYFYISLVTVLLLAFRNIQRGHVLFCGHDSNCSSTFVFILQLLYISFWTWVLNSICKFKYMQVAWFLIVLHCVMVFFILSEAFDLISNRIVSSEM